MVLNIMIKILNSKLMIILEYQNTKRFLRKTIIVWTPKGLSDEINKPPAASDNSFAPKLKWIGNSKLAIEVDGSCFRQEKGIFKFLVLIFFIVYRLVIWSRNVNTKFPLGDCLFGALKLTKDVDLDKYGYSGWWY